MVRKRVAYWYKMYVGECPVCGRNASYKVRMPGAKPRDASKRYVHLPETETYDHCLEG